MNCGICENNATDCECTHHEQAAYEKGRSEAQAEIARLTAEVERWQESAQHQAVIIENLTDAQRNSVTKEFAEIRYRIAWNDAIEAAASYCDSRTYTPEDVRAPECYIAVGHDHAASAIRALKRSTP